MLRVGSWNVNSIRQRLERVIHFLQREKLDILCLQELKCTDDKFPQNELAKIGYHAAIFGQKAYNGVAILSKKPPHNIHRSFDGCPDGKARYIACEIGSITIASIYVPNGQEVGTAPYHDKLQWLAQLTACLSKELAKSPRYVLAGDFNVAPEDIDVYDPDVWRDQVLFSEPEKKALNKLCSVGLHDTFRKHHPEAGQYSWWDYRQLGFPKNHGLRLDFILASSPLFEKCTKADIIRNERKGEKPSDHAPVIAEFAA